MCRPKNREENFLEKIKNIQPRYIILIFIAVVLTVIAAVFIFAESRNKNYEHIAPGFRYDSIDDIKVLIIMGISLTERRIP